MSNKETLTEDQRYTYEFNSLTSLLGQFNSTTDATPSQVKTWLKSPMAYNKQLRDLSRRMYATNGIYSNVIDYMVSLPTLDKVLHGRINNQSKYKRNKDKFAESLRLINYRNFTRDALLKLAIDGIAFYYFETNQSKELPKYFNDTDLDQITEISAYDFNCSTIPLPTDYCQIVGRKNSSYVITFDLSYFNQFKSNGLSLRLRRYPKEIRDGYRAYQKDSNRKHLKLNNDKTLCFKVRSKIEERWGRPLGLAAFIDMLYEEEIMQSKKDALSDFNSSVYYMTFPEGEKKGQSSLTQKQQKDLHNNVRQALFSSANQQGNNFVSLAAGTKLEKLKKDNIEILKDKIGEELINKISTNLGFAGSLLNGNSGGNNATISKNIEMISSQMFSWLEAISDEINKVINKNIIKDRNNPVELYYLPVTTVNKEKQVKMFKDLYTNGKGSLSAWIASTGFDVDAYLALMDYELEENFEEKYPVHMLSYTQSGKEIKTDSTKDKIDDPQNDNTAKNRTNGNNDYPST